MDHNDISFGTKLQDHLPPVHKPFCSQINYIFSKQFQSGFQVESCRMKSQNIINELENNMSFKGFGGIPGANQANQAALLQQHIADQIQAKTIYAQIMRHQQFGSYLAPQPSPARPLVSTYGQMSFMLNMLAQMMQSMMMLNQGFASFLGGRPQQ